MPKEYRIAVGSKDGIRSTVWKFQIQKSDIYILSRMFGSSTKVSLHESADCQWSANADWWKEYKPGTPNAERHMVKWELPRPADNIAQHVFRIHIPRSELRLIETEENLTKVKWLRFPPEDHAISLECYITPPTNVAPEENSTFPHEHLFNDNYIFPSTTIRIPV